jgi:CrcB protein
VTASLGVAGFVAVGVGAVAGAWSRWLLQHWLNPGGKALPLGTLIANLTGGLLIGLALAYFMRHPDLNPVWRLAVVTGFLGALTTFSSFSAESLEMIQRGDLAWAFGHTAAHVLGCLLAAYIGFRLANG